MTSDIWHRFPEKESYLCDFVEGGRVYYYSTSRIDAWRKEAEQEYSSMKNQAHDYCKNMIFYQDEYQKAQRKLEKIKALLEERKRRYQASVAGPLLISAIKKILEDSQ